MANIMTMTSTGVTFEKQINGYDKTQVDRYIDSIAQAYQIVYEEFISVCYENNDLLKKNDELTEQMKNTPNADAIARALISAELLAHEIIDDAKTEAEAMRARAQAELTVEINNIISKLMSLGLNNEPLLPANPSP